jgi:hypothetical protein
VEQTVSRLSDDEMKVLMIDVVKHCSRFLFALFATDGGDEFISKLKQRDFVPRWNDPEM